MTLEDHPTVRRFRTLERAELEPRRHEIPGRHFWTPSLLRSAALWQMCQKAPQANAYAIVHDGKMQDQTLIDGLLAKREELSRENADLRECIAVLVNF